MKKSFILPTIHVFIAAISVLVVFNSCWQKELSFVGGGNTTSYNSLADFHSRNGVPLKQYSINAVTGGSFTTSQGTIVTIPPNNFLDGSGNPVTGNVDISFRDIYTKSDMLLSDIPTSSNGSPIKSAGEFFILAQSGAAAVQIVQPILVQQPANGQPVDTAMQAFLGGQGANGVNGFNWVNQTGTITIGNVSFNAGNYVFSLFRFGTPIAAGTWCNSDNPNYFASYPQIQFTIHATDDMNSYYTDVFLVFKNVKSMVHVYRGSANDFPYNFAPQGLDCTVVAVGVKDGKLYSSFLPVTIGINQTVNFTLSETNTDEFKSRLQLLN